MARKRIYKRAENNKKFKKPKDKEAAIKKLEETGILSDYLSPSMIQPRLEFQYKRIIRLDKLLELDKVKNDKIRQQRLKAKRKEAVKRFTHLTFPLIHSIVKRYNITGMNDDLKNSAIIDVLTKLFVDKTYKPEKSAITSYVFEIAKWAIIREVSKYVENYKKNISLYTD